MHHRGRTTADPRIIRPPETLVNIGEYDEYDQREARIGTTTPALQTEGAVVFTRKPVQSAGLAMPRSSISEEVAPNGESNPLEQT
ncbi:hypothetical protein TELCIR_21218, partial [Teladorsagia circumcincta]